MGRKGRESCQLARPFEIPLFGSTPRLCRLFGTLWRFRYLRRNPDVLKDGVTTHLFRRFTTPRRNQSVVCPGSCSTNIMIPIINLCSLCHLLVAMSSCLWPLYVKMKSTLSEVGICTNGPRPSKTSISLQFHHN